MSEDAQARFERALDCIDQGRHDEARALAAEMHAVRFSGAFEIDALAARAEGDLAAAAAHLRRGLEAAPQVWVLWQLLGITQTELGHHDEAAASYDRAMECPSVDPVQVGINRAVLDVERGDFAAARAALAGLREETRGGPAHEDVERAWFWCLRTEHGEVLGDGAQVFDVTLNAAWPSGEGPPDAHRFVVQAHVAARSADDVARVVARDLGDELPGAVVEQCGVLQDAAGFDSGIYWMSGRVAYPANG